MTVTILCLASYFKGTTFLKAAKAEGARVLLLTREKIANEPWPRESIDDIFLMPNLAKQPDITHAVSYLMRSNQIDRIVPLDDYDVETAAALREHLRLPGLGDTSVRYFRDKLAMRGRAAAVGIPVPAFTAVFNYDQLRHFMATVPGPWLLKPRSEAGAMGIKRISHPDEVWHWLNELGDKQSHFSLEQFLPGEMYHVDSIVWDGKVVFATPHKYTRPPLSVSHDGGVFATRTLPADGEEAQQLVALTKQLLPAFGMERGVAHTEFLRAEANGRFHFIETAARVGGANIEQLVEASSGINLWGEWAKLEIRHALGQPYAPPTPLGQYAGVLVCLARQQHPDLSGYQDAEIVYRVHKEQHAGLVVASPSVERVEALIYSYAERFAHDFLAYAPPLDTAPT